MRIVTVVFCLLITSIATSQIPEQFQSMIKKGHFSKAQQQMRQALFSDTTLTPSQRLAIQFEIERLDRIRLDFRLTQNDVLAGIRKFMPNTKPADLRRWESTRALECMIIDGQRRYFKWAVPNLFRIDKDARAIKQRQQPTPAKADKRLNYVNELVRAVQKGSSHVLSPERFRIVYTLTVNADAVPDGYIIRCWLPFPRHIPDRQTDIRLVSSTPEERIVADNEHYLQRTIYLEQPAVSGEPTRFQAVYEFTNFAAVHIIDPDRVIPATITPELAPYISERPPHIVFTPALRRLAAGIVGDEQNPYRIAQRLFAWIDSNIPWASAREYSTFRNISEYVRVNRHADCGMKSIFFITLCRMYHIPARWQSGWRTEPGSEGMHDWGEIYFAPYGWVPVDVDNGLLVSDNPAVRWFYLGSMDAYRMIVNDDFAQHLFPAKIHFRSETIDFQRGEVEWQGGNLYFNQWDYNFSVEKIQPDN